jgi:hypothetical protein
MHFYYFFAIVSNKTIFLIPSDLHLNFEKCVERPPFAHSCHWYKRCKTFNYDFGFKSKKCSFGSNSNESLLVNIFWHKKFMRVRHEIKCWAIDKE